MAPRSAEPRMTNQSGSLACQNRKLILTSALFCSMKISRTTAPLREMIVPALSGERSTGGPGCGWAGGWLLMALSSMPRGRGSHEIFRDDASRNPPQLTHLRARKRGHARHERHGGQEGHRHVRTEGVGERPDEQVADGQQQERHEVIHRVHTRERAG